MPERCAPDPSFDLASDEEFERVFLDIIGHGRKDNTYKFALARFLLDYSRESDCTRVDFAVVAKHFLEYYWTQICKHKMKHAPQAAKRPEVVHIIEREFAKSHYPETFDEICAREPEKIQRCTDRIAKKCFHDVTWRFQRTSAGGAETGLFFGYRISREVNPNRKYVDLEYGMRLNPAAIRFLRRCNTVLLKAVTLEWARFLENLNVGLPKLIAKTEGGGIECGPLTEYRRILYPLFAECFYCGCRLSWDAEVEHVIPFDFIAESDIWNLTLACRRCSDRKRGALPPREYIDKLVERNRDYRERIPGLDRSLGRLDRDFGTVVEGHYQNALSRGYFVLNGLCGGSGFPRKLG